MPYFGVIEKIWELDYNEFRVLVFKCKWVNANTSVHQDQLGFTLVDLNKVAYMENLSLWQNKPDKSFTSKIHVIQDCQWFYKEEQVVFVTKMMIQHLTFVRGLLFANECLL